MRKFTVIVKRPLKKAIFYPEMDGEKSLELMNSIHERGLDSTAYTIANGIEEILTLTEMREIFG